MPVGDEILELAGGAVCTTGCKTHPDGYRHPPKLLEACNVFAKCLELAARPETIRDFPNLDERWCENTIEQFGALLCAKSSDGLGSSIISEKLANVVEIASAGKAHVDYGSCGLSDIATCEDCLVADHRGGVQNYWATSYACAWHGGRCVPAHQGAPAVTDLASCDGNPVPEDLQLVGEAITGTSVAERRGATKMALLISLRYTGTKNELKGTTFDAQRVFHHLVNYEKFSPEHITVFHDTPEYDVFFQGANLVHFQPWRSLQLLKVIQTSISQLKSSDFFLFYYSGHGFVMRDHERDELDGLDEVIALPNGELLTDDDFYKELAKIPKGVSVTAFADACHSEGFSDLPFNYMHETRTWCTDWTGLYEVNTWQNMFRRIVTTPHARSLPQADITFIAGSQNHQTSVELGGEDGGALSLLVMRLWQKPTGRKGWFGLGAKRQPMQFHEAIQSIVKEFDAEEEIDQVPNVAAWPTFRDYEPFSPFSADFLVKRDPALGGPIPFEGARAIAPRMCEHGGLDEDGVSHQRKAKLIAAASEHFFFSDGLSDATNERIMTREGWHTGKADD